MTTTTAKGVAVRSEIPDGALVISSTAETLSDAQIEAFGLKEASRGERLLFIHVVQKTGLDPAARQIYSIGRNVNVGNYENPKWQKKFTIQTGIDGYRLIARRAASRSGHELSYGPTEWCGFDGVWVEAWLGEQPPAAARVTVFRDGGTFPAVALFREYKQEVKGKLTDMWRRMPSNQIAKCAEALALRKAYPQELSGLYIDEEMQQADGAYDQEAGRRFRAPRYAQVRSGGAQADTPAEGVTVVVDDLVTGEQTNRIIELMNEAGVPDAERLDFVAKTVNRRVNDPSQLTGTEAQKLIDALQERAKQPDQAPAEKGQQEEGGPLPPPDQDPTVNGEIKYEAAR